MRNIGVKIMNNVGAEMVGASKIHIIIIFGKHLLICKVYGRYLEALNGLII